MTGNLHSVRSAWRQLSKMDGLVTLRVGVVASYTADPLVPYLGMALHDAGLPARFALGPYDQIMRQCLDDGSATALSEPDVLIVAPRFEELGGDHPRWTPNLVELADAAVSTVGCWAGCLAFVLPALPETREFGVGDSGQVAGVVAEATRAREAVRAKLAGLPNVLVADAEEAVRAVGAGNAYSPTMFRVAKVPYTEELFACLADQLGRLLRVRHGLSPRAVVIDAAGLLADENAAAALRTPLLTLHRAGVRLSMRGEPDWTSLAKGAPELVGVLRRSDVDDLHALLLTADPGLADSSTVVLGPQPESWAAQLGDAGLFDQPAPPMRAHEPVAPLPAVAPVVAQASLADFVAGLDVVVSYQPAQDHLRKVAEVVERAKDFTMGVAHTAADIVARADEALAISVRDRFGDYGVSGAVALRRTDGECVVDLFSLSCPVLGKEVEDEVLREIVRRAGGADVVFRFKQTEHNAVTAAFLEKVASPTVRTERWDAPAPKPAQVEPVVPFGIVAFGQSLPEPVDVNAAASAYTEDPDRLAGWGYRRFHRAPDDVGLTDLAVAAGAKALAEAGLDAGDVDLVVLAIPDLAEYLYWDPAAATQARLGAHGAEAVLVNQACGGGVAAFDVVAGKFAVHPEYRTALLIGANRVCEPYWNRMEINTSVYSDGAAAAVIRRDHGTCRWLATEIITDGTYADFMRMEVGATARPFTADCTEQPHVRGPQDRLEEFFHGDVRQMFKFVSTLRARSREVVDAACARAGVAREDIKRVLHFNDNVKQLTELAGDLGIPLDRTNVETALDHGHVGCADQLLALDRLLADGELADGDLVALTSTSSGMHWICTLLRV
ncbi:3-oxoacyl-[acyl-carrier-protein] synthase III C-terminal domain-containing protein [Lentzea sp. NPDC005914]|uniref:3-oxoacyl-[acyl-carrier-protein] synthase III C-terminal domain-containing protein n=1 Tax=Lentzea sp. NPDC005914 TaxID=3154572 RepID=UPI0033C01252